MPRSEAVQAALIQRRQTRHEQLQEIGMTPEQLADITVEGIRQDRLYIIADPERTTREVRLRLEGILRKE